LETEPKNNVSQAASLGSLPILHQDSAKLHAPIYPTLQILPPENAFSYAPLVSTRTPTTTSVKINAQGVNLPTRQQINALVHVLLHTTATTMVLEP
jgi:hypothetical protein